MKYNLLNLSHMKFLFNTCIVAVLTLVVGCDRVFENEIVSSVPPELHVIVLGSDSRNDRVAGASVALYRMTEDGPEATAWVTKQTNAEGEAVFTQAELAEPGLFQVIATQGSRKGENTIKYLLLNDGQTLHFIQLA